MTNVILAGVGGQGVLLSCRVLMEAARRAGHDVKESEVHGMAQRGGSVDCHVRYGKNVASPLIPRGAADILVAFELCEAVRKLEYLAPDGRMLVNNLQIEPSTVQSGAMEYPADLDAWLQDNVTNLHVLNTLPALRAVGSKRCLNILMLGAASGFTGIDLKHWTDAVETVLKPQHVDMNLKAFELGRQMLA